MITFLRKVWSDELVLNPYMQRNVRWFGAWSCYQSLLFEGTRVWGEHV